MTVLAQRTRDKEILSVNSATFFLCAKTLRKLEMQRKEEPCCKTSKLQDGNYL